MTAAVFEADFVPRGENEVNKTKLLIYRSPAAGINTVLATVGFRPFIVSRSLNIQSAVNSLSNK